jgi:hypothetical protein
MKFLDDIKASLWMAGLMRSVSKGSKPREQWFVNVPDRDLKWLADEPIPAWADETCRAVLLEARREMARRVPA